MWVNIIPMVKRVRNCSVNVWIIFQGWNKNIKRNCLAFIWVFQRLNETQFGKYGWKVLLGFMYAYAHLFYCNYPTFVAYIIHTNLRFMYAYAHLFFATGRYHINHSLRQILDSCTHMHTYCIETGRHFLHKLYMQW